MLPWTLAHKGEASGCFGGNRSRARQREQKGLHLSNLGVAIAQRDKILREYAVRFGRVERTLYREMQKGADAARLSVTA